MYFCKCSSLQNDVVTTVECLLYHFIETLVSQIPNDLKFVLVEYADEWVDYASDGLRSSQDVAQSYFCSGM